MSFNRASTTAPRVWRLAGERHDSMLSVADLCFGGTFRAKPGSRGTVDVGAEPFRQQEMPTLLRLATAASTSDVKDHRRMKTAMSKAELDPGSAALQEAESADEFMKRFRHMDSAASGTPDSLSSNDKARTRKEPSGLNCSPPPSRGVRELARPGSSLGSNLKPLRRSASHGAVVPAIALGGGLREVHEHGLRLSPNSQRKGLPPTEASKPKGDLSRNVSLPRMPPRRNTTGF